MGARDQVGRGGKLHRALRVARYPLLFEVYRNEDERMWIGFTDLMEEEGREMDRDRVEVMPRLLMMSAEKWIQLSKISYTRLLFGIPEDFRDRAVKCPNYFRTVVEEDGRRVLELVDRDPDFEKEYNLDEDRVKNVFKFPLKLRGTGFGAR